MNKSDLLKSIAEKGYDVGFGAKKHFATYDIIEKVPGLIGFSSMAFGVFALVVKNLSTEITSAMFIVLGVVGLYISLYDHKKAAYEKSGVTLTQLNNELKALYLEVKNLNEDDNFLTCQEKLLEIEERYYKVSISKQILFSNWYAHYKFFWEQQIGWINEQLNFKFLRDKVPLSLWLGILIAATGAGVWFFDVVTYICSIPKP